MPDHKPITPEALDRLAAKLDAWAREDAWSPADKFAGQAFTNFKSGPRQHPSFAHIPGTGPAGETCNSCADGLPGKKPACAQFTRLTGKPGKVAINLASPACKYWRARGKR